MCVSEFDPRRDVDAPKAGETLDQYIDSHGIEHFKAREVLRLRRLGVDAPEPPRRWWPRIIPTLRVAEYLRSRVGPLSIGNGYRPEPLNSKVGGAKNSQHLHFRALDLDLVDKSRRNQEEFYRAAGELYLTHGVALKMGLGLYRMWRGTRVHVDCGYRKRAWKPGYVKELLESLR